MKITAEHAKDDSDEYLVVCYTNSIQTNIEHYVEKRKKRWTLKKDSAKQYAYLFFFIASF